jgi:hypothetical protein
MSEGRLLLSNQFSAEDVNLGTFQDIVSAHADQPNYFRIGMLRREVMRGGSQMPMGMLVTYENHEGLPRDVKFTCTYGDREVALRRVGKEFHYRTADETITADTDIKRLFARWVGDHERTDGNFTKLDFPFSPDQSLLFPVSLVSLNAQWPKQGTSRLLTPTVFPPLTWVAPVRTKPRRTYDELQRGFSSEGTHTSYLIRKILGTETDVKRFRRIIHQVGKDSGLFDTVDIKRFGTDLTAPFEVMLFLTIRLST